MYTHTLALLWMAAGSDGEGEGEGGGGTGRGGEGEIKSLCVDLIALFTEWDHLTKDLLSLAKVSLQSGNSALALFSASRPEMWPSSALVWRFKRQQHTLYGGLSPTPSPSLSLCHLIKRPVFEGWGRWGNHRSSEGCVASHFPVFHTIYGSFSSRCSSVSPVFLYWYTCDFSYYYLIKP